MRLLLDVYAAVTSNDKSVFMVNSFVKQTYDKI
jgi:hypothetical protein